MADQTPGSTSPRIRVPGVYVEEVYGGSRLIAAVGTSTRPGSWAPPTTAPTIGNWTGPWTHELHAVYGFPEPRAALQGGRYRPRHE
ncbi:MAG: hypothetical protein ACK2TX_05745 [Anaerolineales bacterium]